MREILFRGKRKDNGELVEGYLVKLGKESFSDPERYGICNTAIPIFGNAICYNLKIDEVIPETVGQYMGLEDKNGNKIFEGDICKHRSNFSGNTVISVVTYIDGHFLALVCENSGFELSEKLEIIGNIHDNPELLRGDTE